MVNNAGAGGTGALLDADVESDEGAKATVCFLSLSLSLAPEVELSRRDIVRDKCVGSYSIMQARDSRDDQATIRISD